MRLTALKKITPFAWFFALAALCVVVQLLVVDNYIGRGLNPHYWEQLTATQVVLHLVNHLADAAVLLLPLALLPPRWCRAQWIVLCLLTVWCLAQLLYHPTYRDLMPFSSFLLVQNVGDVLWESIKGSWRWGFLKVIVPPVLLWLLYRWKLKSGVAQATVTGRRRMWRGVALLAVFVLLRTGVDIYYYATDDEARSYISRLHDSYCVVWTRVSNYYKLNGFVPYAAYCAATSIFSTHHLSEAERAEVEQFLAGQPKYDDDAYATGKGKNLIFIVVESLNSWVIDLRVDGREVTPTLNRLCADSTSLVTLRMKAQVKNGRSSDGIFMYHTGLLPLTTTTVAMRYGEDRFPSLVKALPQGYHAQYVCCDEPGLWNVTAMSRGYGYHEFYGKDDLRERLEQNGYLLDKALLEEAGELMSRERQPFAMLIATAGMHQPYTTATSSPTWITRSAEYTEPVRNYLERTAIFDQELGMLLDRLQREGLLANSIVVIASDHNELVDDDPRGRPALDREGDNCVFLVLGTGHGRRIEGPVGQIDIYPTLLDIMGGNSQPWKGLGYSLLRYNITSAATAPGEMAGSSSLSGRQQQAWRVSELLITSRHFNESK